MLTMKEVDISTNDSDDGDGEDEVVQIQGESVVADNMIADKSTPE